MADATLRFDTKIDTGKLESGLKGIGGLVTTSFNLAAIAITATTAAIGTAAVVGMKYNSQMEDYTTNFSTMLGTQEKGIAKVEELKKMASSTPFAIADLAQGTQTLLAFGIESERTTEILRQIGDVSLGNKEKFSGLTLAFSQMSATGKLMGQDLNQMINAGFNPLNEISEMTGRSLADLKDEMSKGAISADMVAEAFKHATDAGGQFYKGMESASKTASGQISTLKDNVLALLGDITKGLSEQMTLDFVPMAIKSVEEMSEAFRTKGVAGMAEAFGDMFAMTVTKLASFAPLGVSISIQFIQSISKGLYDNRGLIIQAASDIGSAILSSIFGADITVHWETFVSNITASFKTFADIASVTLQPVGAVIEGLFKFLLDNSDIIIASLVGISVAMAFQGVATIITGLAASWSIATAAIVANEIVTKGAIVSSGLLRIAFVAQQAVLAILAGEMTLLGGATAVLTTAMNVLKAAIIANPIGAIAVGVGLAVAAIALLSISMNKASAETQDFLNKTDLIIEKSKKLTDEILESNKAFAERADKIKQDTDIASGLLVEIENLSNAHLNEAESANQAADRKALLAMKITELNNLMPELNLNYSEESGLLSMTTEEINNQIVARQALIELKALEEKQIEVARALYEIEKEMPIVLAANQEAFSRYKEETKGFGDDIAQGFDNAFFGLTKFNGGAQKLNTTINATDEQFKVITKSQAELQAESENLNKRIIDLTSGLNKNKTASKENVGATSDLTEETAKHNKSLSSLSSNLSAAEKQYQDVSSAQKMTATSAVGLMSEYSDLISTNSGLLAQYPDLYAALDSNNSVQENGKAIAEAVWKIKKQLLIEELKAQSETIQSNIANLEAQVKVATSTYATIAEAAILAGSVAMFAQEAAAGDAKKTAELALADAKAQADNIKKTIQNLENIKLPTVEIKTSGGGKSGTAAKAVKDAFSVAKDAIKDYADTEKSTTQGQIDKWKELTNIYKVGSKERIEIDKNIRDLTDKGNKESFDNAKKWIDEEKYYNRLSKEDELAAFEEMQASYAEGGEQRQEIDREIYRLQNELASETKQKQIDILSDINYKKVELATSSRDIVIELINDETIAKIASFDEETAAFLSLNNEKIQSHIDEIRRTDEAAADKLQAIENEKASIKGLQESDKERVRLDREASERLRLEKAIKEADTTEDKKKAIQAKEDFETKLIQENKDKQRDIRLKELDKEEKDTIDAAKKRVEEETKAIETAKKEQTTKLESVKAGLEEEQKDIGSTIVQPIVEQIKAEEETLKESGKTINKSIGDGVTENVQLMKKPATNIISRTVDEMKKQFTQFAPFSRDLYLSLVEAIDLQPWKELGVIIMGGLVDGVIDTKQVFIEAVVEALKKALEEGKKALEISSSSQVVSSQINSAISPMSAINEISPFAAISTYDLVKQPLSVQNLSQPLGGYSPSIATAGSVTNNSTVNYDVNITEQPPKPFSQMQQREVIEWISSQIRRVGV